MHGFPEQYQLSYGIKKTLMRSCYQVPRRKTNGDACDEHHWHYLKEAFSGRCQDTITTTITYAGWDGMDNGVDMRAVKVQDYTQDIETR